MSRVLKVVIIQPINKLYFGATPNDNKMESVMQYYNIISRHSSLISYKLSVKLVIGKYRI
jgi:hypothetical protein